jgi:hypothetical protein
MREDFYNGGVDFYKKLVVEPGPLLEIVICGFSNITLG